MLQDEGAIAPSPEAPETPSIPRRITAPEGHISSDGFGNTKVTVDGVEIGVTEVTWRHRIGDGPPTMTLEVPLTSADIKSEVEVLKPLSPGGAGRVIAWVRTKLAACLRAIAGLLEGRIAPP